MLFFSPIIEGIKNGKKMRFSVDLYDKYDRETIVILIGTTAGYRATLTIRLIAEGIYSEKGITTGITGKYWQC